MTDPIITKYLLFICILPASIVCSGRAPMRSCPELACSPERKLLLFLMRKPILQALLELPNGASCWAFSFTWHLPLRDTSTIHRMRNREDRQLNEKYHLKVVITFQRIGTDYFFNKMNFRSETNSLHFYILKMSVKKQNLRKHLILQWQCSNWLIAAAGISKERRILRLHPGPTRRCCNPLVMSAVRRAGQCWATLPRLSIPHLVQLANFTDGKTKNY